MRIHTPKMLLSSAACATLPVFFQFVLPATKALSSLCIFPWLPIPLPHVPDDSPPIPLRSMEKPLPNKPRSPKHSPITPWSEAARRRRAADGSKKAKLVSKEATGSLTELSAASHSQRPAKPDPLDWLSSSSDEEEPLFNSRQRPATAMSAARPPQPTMPSTRVAAARPPSVLDMWSSEDEDDDTDAPQCQPPGSCHQTPTVASSGTSRRALTDELAASPISSTGTDPYEPFEQQQEQQQQDLAIALDIDHSTPTRSPQAPQPRLHALLLHAGFIAQQLPSADPQRAGMPLAQPGNVWHAGLVQWLVNSGFDIATVEARTSLQLAQAMKALFEALRPGDGAVIVYSGPAIRTKEGRCMVPQAAWLGGLGSEDTMGLPEVQLEALLSRLSHGCEAVATASTGPCSTSLARSDLMAVVMGEDAALGTKAPDTLCCEAMAVFAECRAGGGCGGSSSRK